jgi:3-phosphoshikimate 1-carboxyvinyltransferase
MTSHQPFTVAKLPRGFDATVTLPGSKSIALRQLAISALVEGVSHVQGVPQCDDTDAMIECLQALGVAIETTERGLKITGPMDFGDRPINLDARMSGASTRLLIALAALRQGVTRIDGHPSLRARTNQPLFDVLSAHGCQITNDGSGLPVEIQGPMRGEKALIIDGSLSSQYITALMVIAPILAKNQGAQEQHIVIQGDLVSRPYLDITLNEMRKRAVTGHWTQSSQLSIPAQTYQGGDYLVEGDASAASYFSALATLHGGSVTLTNLDASSVQGDYAFGEVMEALGAQVERQGMTRITGPATLTALDRIDMQDMPDVALTLIAMAPLLPSPIEITGLQSLHHKECDRLECPAKELTAMGVSLSTTQSSIRIEPLKDKQPQAHLLTTYHDHRMAMAFATIGSAYGGLTVDDKSVVNKTYPNFWTDYALLGD